MDALFDAVRIRSRNDAESIFPAQGPQMLYDEGQRRMNMLDSLRKGFSFFLLSMGVSSPAKKPRPTFKPVAKLDDGKP